jgi:transcriptional regulator with XRE-family HTH domain
MLSVKESVVSTLGDVAFPDNLTRLRHQRGLTQQALANAAHIHVTQLRRYEAGTSQPTLDVLRRIATTLTTSIDALANDDETLPTDLRHHLQAINQLDPDEQAAIRTLIEATLLRHQARRLAG